MKIDNIDIDATLSEAERLLKEDKNISLGSVDVYLNQSNVAKNARIPM